MSDDEKKPGDVIPLRKFTTRVHGNSGEVEILPPKVTAGPIVRRAFGLREFCMHRSTIVDVEARVVVCRACETELDPFVVLGHLAREPSALAEAIKERKNIQARIELLRAEEKKLSSRVRRLFHRQPAETRELELLRRLEMATRAARSDLAQKALIGLADLRKEQGK